MWLKFAENRYINSDHITRIEEAHSLNDVFCWLMYMSDGEVFQIHDERELKYLLSLIWPEMEE